MKSRRGRTAKVPAAADCAFPGVEKSSSARGRMIVRDVPDAPEVPDVFDVPDVPDVPDPVADVLQVSGAELLGLHKVCVDHEHKVSVSSDNTSVQQPSTNDNTPLTARKLKCEHCESSGRCKKHCVTKRKRLRNVATKKSSGGSREPVDA
jgi:hypothetical protein